MPRTILQEKRMLSNRERRTKEKETTLNLKELLGLPSSARNLDTLVGAYDIIKGGILGLAERFRVRSSEPVVVEPSVPPELVPGENEVVLDFRGEHPIALPGPGLLTVAGITEFQLRGLVQYHNERNATRTAVLQLLDQRRWLARELQAEPDPTKYDRLMHLQNLLHKFNFHAEPLGFRAIAHFLDGATAELVFKVSLRKLPWREAMVGCVIFCGIFNVDGAVSGIRMKMDVRPVPSDEHVNLDEYPLFISLFRIINNPTLPIEAYKLLVPRGSTDETPSHPFPMSKSALLHLQKYGAQKTSWGTEIANFFGLFRGPSVSPRPSIEIAAPPSGPSAPWDNPFLSGPFAANKATSPIPSGIDVEHKHAPLKGNWTGALSTQKQSLNSVDTNTSVNGIF